MTERKRIYLCLAHMSEAGLEQKYIKEAFDTNWVVPLGPNVNAFEEDLEKFCLTPSPLPPSREARGGLEGSDCLSKKRVVALSSGTAAVHLALTACGVKPGDEVIVQSFTFCASSHPITYLGATPVFVDSEKETWNMDPELLEVAIVDRIAKTNKKPKAVVPVALYGMPYQIDRIMEIANRYGIPVIEDTAEGFGSRYNGQMLGTFGKYGVLSFNGNKMITTSGGGALITPDEESWREIMMYATQYRESYPYYQHEKIGFNYRMSNICAGIGRGQMTVVKDHIEHHRHVQKLYEELLKDVEGITVHKQPGTSLTQMTTNDHALDPRSLATIGTQELSINNKVYDSNYWLCTITLAPELKVKGQENAYRAIVQGAVGGAAGVIHTASTAVTDCQPNDNVEAMRVSLDAAGIEARPVWKPMHKQPVYCAPLNEKGEMRKEKLPCGAICQTSATSVAYVNGVSEAVFKVGMCLPAGPYVSDDDVRYIVETIKNSIV
ncbi:MAG: DegT/DnrJ/EryC1/StrS family aminotransferase [Bacteroidaceae bacterium]|nr:DegT/DnrJ/EryC1/StrS family aminotransferase [Bacteroidaceae bacterium]